MFPEIYFLDILHAMPVKLPFKIKLFSSLQKYVEKKKLFH